MVRRLVPVDGPDFYPTPRWATIALRELEPFSNRILEPACGDGAISEVLKAYGHTVVSSDLYETGYGENGVDFLEGTKKYPNIITNPPFNKAEDFVRVGLERSTHKLALLLRLSFLETKVRYNNIYKVNPPSKVIVFSERVSFYPKGDSRTAGGISAHAWFIWDKKADNYGSYSVIDWIPPGFKGVELDV